MTEAHSSEMSDGLREGIAKMRAEGLGDAAVDSFAHYYRRLAAGESGLLRESEIEPVDRLADFDELPDVDDVARAALEQTVVLKLNGGLGTTMGMRRAKSLLEVKDGLTFLDVIAHQVLALRERYGARIPLVLMSSFATRDDTRAALARYPELVADIPLDFLQNKVPKLLADELRPVSWPADPTLEWAPPGHGDLYIALQTSGMLDELERRGYRYAFVSNSDNLGAVLDPRILGWVARERAPFVMEVTDRTPADRKGGHLARLRGGGLVLRESAQIAPEEADAAADIARHRYFNTNNLWLDLVALREQLQASGGVLRLPMIVNRKTVDPADPSSPAVLQLETAMGAAIAVFEGALALRVPRNLRYAPVKTTNDLLVLRSDVYRLDEDFRMVPAIDGPNPFVDLDPAHFKLIDDFDAHFPHGAPSLAQASRLVVEGDVRFGAGIVVRGDVHLRHGGPEPLELADGALLEGQAAAQTSP